MSLNPSILHARYPLILGRGLRNAQPDSTGIAFECWDGWLDLIDVLCERLQFWTDHNHASQVVALQVKEKLGELRFYVKGPISPVQEGMIRMAEAMSLHICERCGNSGKLMIDNGLYLVRCSAHAPDGATLVGDTAGSVPPV